MLWTSRSFHSADCSRRMDTRWSRCQPRSRGSSFRAIILPMPRCGLFRYFSVALLFLAGSFEPAWEIGHAVLHLEAAHDSHDMVAHSEKPADATSQSNLSSSTESDHEHPVFQTPVRPGINLVPSVVALPSNALGLLLATRSVPREAFLAAPARASPGLAHPVQPRAPPLT